MAPLVITIGLADLKALAHGPVDMGDVRLVAAHDFPTASAIAAAAKIAGPRRHWRDLTGQRFGLLVARTRVANDKDQRARWECICNCGRTKVVSGHELTKRKGGTKSCGCLRGRKRSPRFGAPGGQWDRDLAGGEVLETAPPP